MYRRPEWKIRKNHQSSYQAKFTDWNLPLFGMNNTTGRSRAIHLSDSSR